MTRTFHILSLFPFVLAFATAGNLNVGVNQAGYMRQAAKFAETTQGADSFFVVDVTTGAAIFRAPLNLRSLSDPSVGNPIWEGDFSAVNSPGRYRIVTSLADSSAPFLIADTVYNQAYRKSLKGFYFQRCNMALTGPFAGVYQHGSCHALDGQFHTSADTTGFRIVTGGWHDAGDYGKYVVNAGITVGTLLMAYEMFPEKFSQDDTQIPESGNGIPDILDETRYELQWLLKMQRASGAVHVKVTKPKFEGFVMPQTDTGVRMIYEISSAATADFAAVMARAARVFSPFDPTFAATCLSAARKAWDWLEVNPGIVPSGGFHNPPDTETGEYGDGNDLDERLWAAAELFATTGDAVCNSYYVDYYTSAGLFTAPMGWQSVGPMAHLTYLQSKQAGINTNVQSTLRQSLVSYCQTLLSRRNSNGFRVSLTSQEYYWGSNSTVLNEAILLIMGNRENSTLGFQAAAADQLHYILGVNPHAMSFVTGIGSSRPMHPHHRPSASDAVAEPVPGLLAGGPNSGRNDPVLASMFTSTTPAALCYVDDQGSYASNEIAINWNAPLVFVAGYFNEPVATSVMEPRGSLHEDSMRLYQNYPNPFNGMTQISFVLRDPDRVDFVVVDVLGKTVLTKHLGLRPQGLNQFAWRPADDRGQALSTGMYFYYVAGRQRSTVRKLILVN